MAKNVKSKIIEKSDEGVMPAAPETPYKGTAIAFNGLAVYAGVDLTAEIIMRLPFETPVTVETIQGEWARINQPVVGWVEAKLVNKNRVEK